MSLHGRGQAKRHAKERPWLAVQLAQGQGRQPRLRRGGGARDTTRAGAAEARLGPQRSAWIMPKFSPEQRHAIMAAVDALLLQISARVPLYQTAAGTVLVPLPYTSS